MLTYQSRIGKVSYEVELAVVIGETLKSVPPRETIQYVQGYCLAIDITGRDLQEFEKSQKIPWTLSKCLDGFLVLSGELLPPDSINVNDCNIWLKLNDSIKQDGNTRDMVHTVENMLSYLSGICPLYPGDILLTGTPAGVGYFKAEDKIEIGINTKTEKKVYKFDVITSADIPENVKWYPIPDRNI